MDFITRFHALADARSAFCLGVDPSPAVLAHWQQPDTSAGLRAFCTQLAQRIANTPALVKPQSAHFERFGAEGALILQDFIHTMRARDILVLLDVKRGDISETNTAYAAAMFGDAGYAADAITVHPFMGFAALAPFFAAADNAHGYVFVVTASSNSEGIALQQARMDDGKTISEHISHAIAQQNRIAPVCGAVLGATRTDLNAGVFAQLQDALILAPGIGAQGGGYDALAAFPNARNIIPTSARGVLLADNADALAQHCKAAMALRN